MAQNVILIMSNGNIYKFTGPAMPSGGLGFTLVDIKFTKPRKLPNGTHWEDFDEETKP